MPNRYIDRYRQLKSARLKYKQSITTLKQPKFSSFINITKDQTTTSCEPNGNSHNLLQASDPGVLSLTLEQNE